MTDILKDVIGDACREAGIEMSDEELMTAALELRRRIIEDRYSGESWGAGAGMAAAIPHRDRPRPSEETGAVAHPVADVLR